MTEPESALDITLADDALDDDCTCPQGCPHDGGDADCGDVTCDRECPLHGVDARS